MDIHVPQKLSELSDDDLRSLIERLNDAVFLVSGEADDRRAKRMSKTVAADHFFLVPESAEEIAKIEALNKATSASRFALVRFGAGAMQGRIVLYLTDGGWESIDDGAALDPRGWLTLARAEKYATALRTHRNEVLQCDDAKVVFFLHPEWDLPAREKYLLLVRRLPGSPTQ